MGDHVCTLALNFAATMKCSVATFTVLYDVQSMKIYFIQSKEAIIKFGFGVVNVGETPGAPLSIPLVSCSIVPIFWLANFREVFVGKFQRFFRFGVVGVLLCQYLVIVLEIL